MKIKPVVLPLCIAILISLTACSTVSQRDAGRSRTELSVEDEENPESNVGDSNRHEESETTESASSETETATSGVLNNDSELYSEPFRNAFNGLMQSDINLYLEAIPEFYLQRSYCTSGNIGRMSYDEYLTTNYKDISYDHDLMAQEYGEDFVIEFEITSVVENPENILETTQDRWISDWENHSEDAEEYGEYMWDSPQIDNCYIVNITITAEGSISSRTVSQQLDIYEIDGHCYLFFPDMMWNHPITGLLY